MISLYNLSIRGLQFIFFIGRWFNTKLNAGYKGRKAWRQYLSSFKSNNTGKTIWIHCASLGEFEMARPVIDQVKDFYKEEVAILITFFSPSGYELRKNYKQVEGVMYLPLDTPLNAKDFTLILNPDVAIFIKYEFWLNYLNALKISGTKTILVNGLFRKDQSFFKWWGKPFRDALLSFDHVFLQNKESKQLLETIGMDRITVTGDLRYDRVMTIAQASRTYPELEEFRKDHFVLIGGSTWYEEEKILRKTLDFNKGSIRLIIAPHDISEKHLGRIETLFSGYQLKRFSAMQPGNSPQIVLVDTIGHLSSIYKYGDAALVGGGFTGALHNILEPGAFGIPVFFGAMHFKFPEAIYFMETGIGFPVYSSEKFTALITTYINMLEKLQETKNNAARVFKANSGGTDQVFYKIKGYLSK